MYFDPVYRRFKSYHDSHLLLTCTVSDQFSKQNQIKIQLAIFMKMSPIPPLTSLSGVLFLSGQQLPVITSLFIFSMSSGEQILPSNSTPTTSLPFISVTRFLFKEVPIQMDSLSTYSGKSGFSHGFLIVNTLINSVLSLNVFSRACT